MHPFLSFLARPPTVYLLALLAVALVLWGGVSAYLRWQPETVVKRRHEQLIGHIADKKFRKCAPLFSENYLDQWEFDKDDIMLSIRDIGGQFFILGIAVEDLAVTIDGRTARSSSLLRLSGSGSPGAQIVVSEANGIKTPFVFHWRRENWRPWSWRIHRTENEDLPDFRGYRPGDFGAAMRGTPREP